MVARKEIIVLNGGGHKGIVKISGALGKTDFAKISCSLDFRPSGAKLYVIGDNIAQIALNDTNCTVEVPFSATNEVGCVLRSSSLTMFGGSGAKSVMLKKIEEFNKEQTVKAASFNAADKCVQDVAETAREAENDPVAQVQTAIAEDDLAPKKTNDADGSCDKNDTKQYVGVSAKSAVNPLGDWTKYDGNNFYYAVKPQIDEMFICYPEEGLLASTVPNSKWVRVDAESGYYVVGLLYDEDEPSYICYGVPEYDRNGKAPSELENMCVWLPVAAGAEAVGYWIIYQSAKTGEIIK